MKPHHLVFYAVLAIAPLVAQADIYKWVDANGQTHYGERSSDAGTAPTSRIKAPPPGSAPQTTVPSTAYLRAPSKFAELPSPPVQTQNRLLSDGRDHGTNDSRCALAKDILANRLVHGNGKAADDYDRQVAQSDVSLFCTAK